MSRILIVFSGLPGVGKTTIARALCERTGFVLLRADTIESAMVAGGIERGHVGGSGYEVARKVAEENLYLGRSCVIDCVNPWRLTRELFRETARNGQARLLEIEVVCSDRALHRQRVEGRAPEGIHHVTWQDVLARDYEEWDEAPLRIDMALETVEDACERILDNLMGP